MRVFVCSLLATACFGGDLKTFQAPSMLAFEARESEYVSRGRGYALSVTPQSAVLNLSGRAIGMSLSGANSNRPLDALDRMPGKANYIFGHDVRASYDLFGRVLWRSAYPGIDIVFRANRQRLEYDLDIAAAADPKQIKLTFDGIDDIRIDATGDLILRAGSLEIRQPKPVAYQRLGNERRLIDVAYRLDSSHRVGFQLGAYDPSRAFVIDPEIAFDKTFGGSGDSDATGLARDSQGNLYVTGSTDSPDFATVNPYQSRLRTAPLLVTSNAGKTWTNLTVANANSVVAMTAAPSAPLIVYAATPLGVFKSADGGTTWSTAPNAGLLSPATSLAVDASSANTVYAGTDEQLFVSTDGAATWKAATSGLPTTGGVRALAAHPTKTGTVFAALSQPAEIFRSTDFGQSWTALTLPAAIQNEAPVNALIIASNGTLIGATYQNVVISTDNGSTWSTGAAQGVEGDQALAVSPANPKIVYLVNSSGLQRSTDGGNTFTTVLSPQGITQSAALAVDPRNASTVHFADVNLLYQSSDSGQTWTQLSLPYPAVPQTIFVSPADSRLFIGSYTVNSVFITKWSADGSQILYSTYLGGTGVDQGTAIAVDSSGSAYITGSTMSSDFPTTTGAYQTKPSPQDIFVAKLSPDGSQLIYSTVMGSKSSNSNAIAVDSAGEAVIVGSAQGTFPVTPNAFQTTASTATCTTAPYPYVFSIGNAFVTKISSTGGSLVYSTLLGGICGSSAASVTLDASGNAWITGDTSAHNFPVTSDALQSTFGGGYFDGFLARFSPSGGLDYSTYIGGPGYDAIGALAFDSSGNIYLAGESGGLAQPASAGAFQSQVSASCYTINIGPSEYEPQGNALVLKLDPKAHTIEGLTYLGAPGCLSPVAIAVDSAGEPWIAGPLNFAGASPQTAAPLQIATGSAFISKFSADFTQLLFSTYFDSVSGLALDPLGAAYVDGVLLSEGNYSPTQPVYIAKIEATPTSTISLDSIASVVPSVSPSISVGIAPGEVIQLFGKNMGPSTMTRGIISSGVLATNVAGVQVTFDGTPVPLLSVSAQEIDLVAPFELASKTTTVIQVQYNNVQSNAVKVGVSAIVPQILGVYNEDFSANSASNPAAAGSVMSLYGAGIGQTNPVSPDGKVNVAPLPAPAGSMTLEWFPNGNPNEPAILPITFAGAAPGLAAGIFQVNFVAPQQSVQDVNLAIGESSAQFNIAVK